MSEFLECTALVLGSHAVTVRCSGWGTSRQSDSLKCPPLLSLAEKSDSDESLSGLEGEGLTFSCLRLFDAALDSGSGPDS